MKHSIMTFAASLLTQVALAQGIVITGHVTEEDGDVIGGSIIEQDKNGRIISSTVTDINGNLSLAIKNQENKLKISYVGYKTIITPIKEKRRFELTMEDDSHNIGEVQITAKRMHNDGTFMIP